MNLSEFMRAILPDGEGYRFVVEIDDEGQSHRACDTTLEAIANVKALEKEKANVFFALATFKQARYKDEKGRWRRRTQENVHEVRSQWVDLDVGEKEKNYPTKKAALAALQKFCRDAELPMPRLVVDSGNGIHAYWTFTYNIPGETWTKAATIFKALASHFGLKADPTRTADRASILRPIETTNRKPGRKPMPVRLLRDGGKNINPGEWATKLIAAKKKHNIDIKKSKPSPAKATSTINDDLIGGTEYPPSDANRIADKCATLADMRESKGATQDEPLWYQALGVLAFTEQGEELCHEWSTGHPGYDEDVCQQKIEHRLDGAGPTTCDKFRELSPHCKDCTLNCSSPIVLGYPEPKHEEEVQEVDGSVTKIEVPEEMTVDYRWSEKKGLLFRRANEDADDSWDVVSHQLPRVDFLFRDEDNDLEWMGRISIRNRKRWEDPIDIKIGALYSNNSAMATLAGKVGILPTAESNAKPLVNFVKTWIKTARQNLDEMNMRDRMGWQGDGSFVLGTRQYMPDGAVSDVVVSRALASYVDPHHPRGDLKRYCELIDYLYNRPHFQPYQFVWLSSFASVLLPLIHEENLGIPIVLWSGDTGFGKTTISKMAISVWGNPNSSIQSTSAGRTTEYALYLMAGIRRHLPVLMDEVTEMETHKLAEFVYNYSSGQGKLQGSASGGLRNSSLADWQNFIYVTSNQAVSSTISATRHRSEAQIARIFEVHFTDKKLVFKDGEKVNELWKHYAVAGDAFMRKLVKDRARAIKMVQVTRRNLAAKLGVSTGARYWMDVAACTIVAAHLTKRWGLHAFDVSKIERWIESQIADLDQISRNSFQTTEDTLSELIGDIYGGLIVTSVAGGTGRPAPFAPGHSAPRAKITGRVVAQTGDIWLPISTIRAWCAEHRVEMSSLREDLKARKWLVDADRYMLGRGTNIKVPQQRCWHINWSDISKHLSVVGQASADDTEEAEQ